MSRPTQPPRERPSRARWAAAATVAVTFALLGADHWVKHATLTGPPAHLQLGPDGRLQPLDATRERDGVPDRLFRDPDAYYWLAYAGQMIERGTLRMRATHLDNAPEGREVHWSSGTAWLLVALAAPIHAFGTTSWGEALSTAGLLVHPLLWIVLVVGTTWILSRRLHWLAAAATTSCFLLSPVLSSDMIYGLVDHHALQLLSLVGALVSLAAAGAGTAPASQSARRFMIASGVLSGCALWVQALFSSLVLAGAVAGGVLAGLVWGGRRGVALLPEQWRIWGVAGGATSLGLWAVEYFPQHVGMRLEVNHPLHAVALVCGGELACRVLRLRAGVPRGHRRADVLAVALCAAGAAVLPAAAMLGPVDWFSPRDESMLLVHRTIAGFRPGMVLFSGAVLPLRTIVEQFGALPLVVVAALAGLGARRADARAKVAAATAAGGAAVGVALFLALVRNSGIAVATLACLAAATFSLFPRGGTARGLSKPALALALAMLAGSGYSWTRTFHGLYRFVGTNRFDPEWAWAMGLRDVAWRLGREIPPEDRIAMTDTVVSPSLFYFGDIAVTASLYWENREGLAVSTSFFAAQDEATPLAIAAERRFRFVVFRDAPPFERDPVRGAFRVAERFCMLHDGGTGPDAVRRSLAYRLATGTPPPWLVDVSPQYPPAARLHIRIYRVVPELAAGLGR